MTVGDATPHPPAAEDPEDKHRLTALEGLAAQRGFVLNRAVTSGTDNVVVCRLRFRLRHLAPDEEPGQAPVGPSATTQGPARR